MAQPRWESPDSTNRESALVRKHPISRNGHPIGDENKSQLPQHRPPTLYFNERRSRRLGQDEIREMKAGRGNTFQYNFEFSRPGIPVCVPQNDRIGPNL